MAAPLAASLIKKPLRELVNALYGLAQGLFSEVAYAAGRYKRCGLVEAAAGALAGIRLSCWILCCSVTSTPGTM
jgi:ABC-type thiamin/hydroxymethylpyrimidine transport system permease subunit